MRGIVSRNETGKNALIASRYHDRADVLMSAGCSTFVSAALILARPRVGIVMLEILLGLFLIACTLVARAHLRRKARAEGSADGLGKTKAR
jgi:hypothetical protein